MPGEGGAAGRGGGAIGATAGFAATGAGAAGFGAAMGLAATAGLRAGALRAAGFRAGALRAEVFFAVVLRAGAFFLAAPVLRAVLRTARAVARPVLRAVRAAFLTVLRGLAFLVVLRFFPLVFVAMASAPICSVTALDRSNGPPLHDSRFTGPGLPSHQASQSFFSLYDDRQRKWQFGVTFAREHQQQALSSSVTNSREGAQNVLDCHAMAKIGVDEPGFDTAIRADHQRRGWAPSTRHDLEIVQDRCRIGGRSA